MTKIALILLSLTCGSVAYAEKQHVQKPTSIQFVSSSIYNAGGDHGGSYKFKILSAALPMKNYPSSKLKLMENLGGMFVFLKVGVTTVETMYMPPASGYAANQRTGTNGDGEIVDEPVTLINIAPPESIESFLTYLNSVGKGPVSGISGSQSHEYYVWTPGYTSSVLLTQNQSIHVLVAWTAGAPSTVAADSVSP